MKDHYYATLIQARYQGATPSDIASIIYHFNGITDGQKAYLAQKQGGHVAVQKAAGKIRGAERLAYVKNKEYNKNKNQGKGREAPCRTKKEVWKPVPPKR